MRLLCLFALSMLCWSNSFAQKIDYSEPGREDTKYTSFEIIGKINGHFLVYKNIRVSYSVSVFDDGMKEVSKSPLAAPQGQVRLSFLLGARPRPRRGLLA